MSEVLGSIWWMIVALGVLVTFHEFGHYWVARRCGVKVLRFSVGFGKPLWSRRDRHGTEFAVAAIPLGGYVKMLDEAEGEVPAAQLDQAFNRKSVWQRIAVVAAGPLANVLLCVILLWAMFVIGKQDYSATLGSVSGLAAEAGFQRGDRIVRIGDRAIDTWTDASIVLTKAAIDGDDLPVQVETAAGGTETRSLPLSRLPAGFDQENAVALSGLVWQHWETPAVVGKVAPGAVADGVLKPGDTVTAVDGHAVHGFDDIARQVDALGKRGGSAQASVQQTHARHILIKVNEVVSETEARRKMENLRERLVNGGDFAELALLYSQDGSAAKGGDLGWISPGDTVPEFETAMDALKDKQLSPVVQSPFGMHLIQVLERRQRDVSGERQRATARQALRERKLDDAYQDWLRQIRDRAYVEVRLDEK